MNLYSKIYLITNDIKLKTFFLHYERNEKFRFDLT